MLFFDTKFDINLQRLCELGFKNYIVELTRMFNKFHRLWGYWVNGAHCVIRFRLSYCCVIKDNEKCNKVAVLFIPDLMMNEMGLITQSLLIFLYGNTIKILC